MGRANNNGNANGSTTQTISLPVNTSVRISNTTTLSSTPKQIQPSISQNILKLPNQYHKPLTNTAEHLTNHTNHGVQITTTNVILDYLLFLSINAKIDQAKTELRAEGQQQPSSFHNKKGQGVEAIVDGLLQSHRTQTFSVLLPLSLKHRLYLCQLLHLKSPKQRAHRLPTCLSKYGKHFKNALLSRCRKHRKSICVACQQHPKNSSITPPMSRRRSTPPKPIPTRRTAPGLIDAIPVFLNTSAITYRLAHEQLDFEHHESMTVSQTWYALLLDLLTQAAIECYFCDSYSSMDTLLEIFSYGDIDPSDYHSDVSESDDDDPHFAATRADDYLLWQRTAYLDEFRQKKKIRMEEGKLEEHLENLANKYSVRNFETGMLNYCQKVTGCLDIPTLTNYNDLPGEIIPGEYHGGIDIPMSDEEDTEEDTNYGHDRDLQFEDDKDENNLKKRRLSESDGSKSQEIKKKKNDI
ncbi:2457_t:CDS:2 [Funneliformis caledonium]|uniref:2457_t:CDS:1 n=1 Tax=Funneliformis caledonium TaxID=1117310 RepID=A0A9N9FR95_9GLOM|nr:2457_t:CDS:2 [Funneliformis caledonium]